MTATADGRQHDWRTVVRVVARALGRDAGQSVATIALALPALLGMGALTVDVGQAFVERRQLQNAVDAAALAAAPHLPTTSANRLAEAKASAISYAALNGVTITTADISFAATHQANDTVVVQAQASIPFIFARLLGIGNASAAAHATAQVGSIASATGVMPFGLLQGARTFGTEVQLTQPPGSAFGPGNYGLLALDGTGASVLRATIGAGGSTTGVTVGGVVETDTGKQVGPTKGGLDDWATSHGDTMNSSCRNWAASHTYADGQLSIDPECRYRVVLVPVIDSYVSGHHPANVVAFARIYIADVNGNADITAYFIEDVLAMPGTTLGAVDNYGTKIARLTQ